MIAYLGMAGRLAYGSAGTVTNGGTQLFGNESESHHMRLLYVIDSLAPGGAETSLAELAPALVAAGLDLHVLPLGRAAHLRPQLESVGAVIHTPQGGSVRSGNVRSVLSVARRVQPNLIHTTLYESDVAGRIAARFARVPSSTSWVSDSYGPAHYAETKRVKLALAQSVDALTARLASRFHAVSGVVADNVAKRLSVDRNLVDVIPRGRDPQRFHFRPSVVRDRVRHELGITDSARVILALGRLEPPKGLQDLLAALPTVAAEVPHLVVLIAGSEGRSSAQLKATASSLSTDVRFLGHRTDAADLLAAADVLCLPSEREGFPGTLVEALAVGCPIVASDIAPSREVLGFESTGVLTQASDNVGLGRALLGVLNDPAGAQTRALAGRARFESHLTTERVARLMVDFFLRAAAQ